MVKVKLALFLLVNFSWAILIGCCSECVLSSQLFFFKNFNSPSLKKYSNESNLGLISSVLVLIRI